jgi:hypothetical protein
VEDDGPGRGVGRDDARANARCATSARQDLTDMRALDIIETGLARLQWLAAAAKFELAMRRHELALKAGFNPAQPRDDHGRWTDTGKGELLPFAQQEMAQRFIYGVDEEFEQDILTYVRHATDDSVFGVVSNKEREAITKAVELRLKEMITGLKDYWREDLLSIVEFMSKTELAAMAHAMVELTSKKRRFSPDAETVGGPIDVAVISRYEGFIWIARKQYFDPKLNPHYFSRVYGQDEIGAADAEQ